MEISEKALSRLVRDVDDQHREEMEAFPAQIAELHHGEGRRLRTSRRSFVARAGGAGAVIAVGSTLLPVARMVAAYAQEEEDAPTDAELAAFAESIELAAVETYRAAAASGKITSAAVLQAASTFAGHHQEHAAAFAAAAGGQAKGEPNPTVVQALSDQLQVARDQNGVVAVAFDVENAAASTYLFAIGAMKEAAAVQLAASILPVESQHAVALGQLLGRSADKLFPPHPDPTKRDLPNAFETKDRALDPGNHPVPGSETGSES